MPLACVLGWQPCSSTNWPHCAERCRLFALDRQNLTRCFWRHTPQGARRMQICISVGSLHPGGVSKIGRAEVGVVSARRRCPPLGTSSPAPGSLVLATWGRTVELWTSSELWPGSLSYGPAVELWPNSLRYGPAVELWPGSSSYGPAVESWPGS